MVENENNYINKYADFEMALPQDYEDLKRELIRRIESEIAQERAEIEKLKFQTELEIPDEDILPPIADENLEGL